MSVVSLVLVATAPSWLCFCTSTATTEIYTLSLHDALPIFVMRMDPFCAFVPGRARRLACLGATRTELRRWPQASERSEEHTSELQSLRHLVCRLLLEKKKRQARRVGVTSICCLCSTRPSGR